jgi:hypothetical protein
LFLIGLFLKIFSSETTWPNEQELNLSFNSLCKSYLSFNRGEDFKKSANQKQELLVATMFVNGSVPLAR